MFKVLLVVPYPELEETVRRVYETYFIKEEMQVDIRVIRVDEIHLMPWEETYDFIIGRGYSAAFLKKRANDIPVLEIPITGYDVMRALMTAQRKYGSQKTLVIVSATHNHDEHVLSRLTGQQVSVKEVTTFEQIGDAVYQAKCDGYQIIVGGYSAVAAAEGLGLSVVTIETGEEAIIQSFRETVRMKETILKERERRKIYETITQTSKEGLIYINSDGVIELANKKILQMLYTDSEYVHGKELQMVYPFFADRYREVMRTGQTIFNEVQEIQNIRLSVDYTPVIVSDHTTGVVISCQSVKNIQQRESQIRKKLSEKGLVASYTFSDVIRESMLMEHTIQIAQKYANVSSNILIVGETGTGKELMAQSIHNASERRNGPFVAVNCAAFPENLLESELFGYVDGAFTGSKRGGKVGLFEQAHRGTLFLDEISELPINFQGKLLRVLQERQVRRIGDDKVIDVDARIIAATNKNLRKMVQEKEFRQDLLYRLDVLKICIPPLRERKEDILPLFYYFLKKYNNRFGKDIEGCTQEAENTLIQHQFEGNIRELRNITERLSVICEEKLISGQMMNTALYPENAFSLEVPDKKEMPEKVFQPVYMEACSERDRIIEALRYTKGKKGEAALILGMDRSTLWRKMKSYHLD
ncbi:sigma 54-interacting transcriptional regulator [Faecalicatena sp. Marseille-Q4148]|nr:sigma 54-interacting transcriptional regulator [Faecalicatena sp. Marseille-Q4148]